jgi:hypothetical protein
VAIVAAAFDSRLSLFFFEALVVVVGEATTRSTSSFARFSALAYSSVPSHLFKEKEAFVVDDFSAMMPRRRNFETACTEDASTPPPKREEGKAKNERRIATRRKFEKRSFEGVVIVYRFGREGGFFADIKWNKDQMQSIKFFAFWYRLYTGIWCYNYR